GFRVIEQHGCLLDDHLRLFHGLPGCRSKQNQALGNEGSGTNVEDVSRSPRHCRDCDPRVRPAVPAHSLEPRPDVRVVDALDTDSDPAEHDGPTAGFDVQLHIDGGLGLVVALGLLDWFLLIYRGVNGDRDLDFNHHHDADNHSDHHPLDLDDLELRELYREQPGLLDDIDHDQRLVSQVVYNLELHEHQHRGHDDHYHHDH